MVTFLIILVLSFILSIFLYIDILPYIKRKMFPSSERYIDSKIGINEYSKKLVEASLKMINSKDVEMINFDERPFIQEFDLLLRKLKIKKTKVKTWLFHFPKAFLFIEIIRYLNANNKDLKNVCDAFKYYEKRFNDDIDFLEISRIPWGHAALLLYSITKNADFKKLADRAYEALKNWRRENGIIYYFQEGKYKNLHFVDGQGMFIPFLVDYYKEFKLEEAKEIAIKNFSFFTQHGLDNNGLPYHNIKGTIPIGPNNWGRGIGWYILGLISINEISNLFIDEAHKLIKVLKDLEESEFLWSQFPGASHKIDSSSTLPFIKLFLSMNYDIDESVLLNTLTQLTLPDGRITKCSGDTRDINTYSVNFSTSEFSQSQAISILSLYEKNRNNQLLVQ